MHTIITRFLDFLFPLSCAGCGAVGALVCSACVEKLSPAKDVPEGILSFFDYRNNIVRRGIWELKYRGTYGWADVFGALVHERLLEELADAELYGGFENPLIVPVPLAEKRLRERGYNQALLIVRALTLKVKGEGAPSFTISEHALTRIRETPKQMEIKNRKERLLNMVSAFSANANIVREKNVLVVDDVSTTGATLRACRDALLAAGARKVILVSVAH